MMLPHPTAEPAAALPNLSEFISLGRQRLVSHDLPNQMVVLQGLLQMLDAEEGDRLSDDGREYVQRLLNVARKATGMVRVLKELDRIPASAGRPEAVTLTALARELHGELQARLPQHSFVLHERWEVPVVQVVPRPFHQATLELLQVLVGKSSEADHWFVGSSRSTDLGTEVSFRKKLAKEPLRRGNPAARLDASPEGLLAREWLAVLGATLVADDEGFTILLPTSTAHG